MENVEVWRNKRKAPLEGVSCSEHHEQTQFEVLHELCQLL